MKAPSKTEIARYYEHLMSVIWSMLKQLHDCTEIKSKITQERLIFKLLENDLEKTKRIRQILELYREPISEFDLTQFKSDEET
jgi:hypothetical protein